MFWRCLSLRPSNGPERRAMQCSTTAAFSGCGRATRSRVVRSSLSRLRMTEPLKQTRPQGPVSVGTPRIPEADDAGCQPHPYLGAAHTGSGPSRPCRHGDPLLDVSWDHVVLGPLNSTLRGTHEEHAAGLEPFRGPVMIQRADGLPGPCLHRVPFRLAMASPISPVWPCLLPTRPLPPTSSSAKQAAPLRLIRHI